MRAKIAKRRTKAARNARSTAGWFRLGEVLDQRSHEIARRERALCERGHHLRRAVRLEGEDANQQRLSNGRVVEHRRLEITQAENHRQEPTGGDAPCVDGEDDRISRLQKRAPSAAAASSR